MDSSYYVLVNSHELHPLDNGNFYLSSLRQNNLEEAVEHRKSTAREDET